MSWPGLRSSDGAISRAGRADARHQRRGRGHDDARRAAGHGVQRPRARGCHAEMRRQPAIRIDFVRRKRQDGAVGRRLRQPFERRQKEATSATRLLDVAVGRHDVQTTPCGSACAAAATNSAFAGRVSPDDRARGTSMPLRATAVLSSARRLSDVEVATTNYRCLKLPVYQARLEAAGSAVSRAANLLDDARRRVARLDGHRARPGRRAPRRYRGRRSRPRPSRRPSRARPAEQRR